MGGTVGIEHLKLIVDLGLAGVEAGVGIAKEGKIDAQVLADLVPVLMAAPPAIAAIGEVPAEISDLDESEAADLVAYVMGKLSIDDVKAKAVISASLKCAVAIVALVQAIKS